MTEESEFDSRQGREIFINTASRAALGPTCLPTQSVLGGLSSGIKWPGIEAELSESGVARLSESCERKNMAMSPGGPEPRKTVLARTSSNLPDQPTEHSPISIGVKVKNA
jgi:hypothetical protein